MAKRNIDRGLALKQPSNLKGLPFTCVEDTDTGKVFVSYRRATSDMTYYFVIKAEHGGDFGDPSEWPKHVLTLEIVSPTYLRKSELRRAWMSWGSEDLAPDTDACLIEILRSYGHRYVVAELGGENFAHAYKRLRQEAEMCAGLFGFYVDRRYNAYGNTGWDALRGVVGPERAQDVADEAKACAELIACFALAGIADPELHPDSCAETAEELLTELSNAYVRDWLIAHPYKRRRRKRAA